MPNSSSSREFYRERSRRSIERNDLELERSVEPEPAQNVCSVGGHKSEAPSKTVHMSNIGARASNREIIAVGVPFGKIINFLNIGTKNQALIEFENITSARDMVEYCRRHDVRIRNRNIAVRYSVHGTISARKADDNEYDLICREHSLKDAVPVLRASVNSRYRIVYPDFEQLFLQFGRILRMLVFDKSGYTQALIEMADVQSAIIAKITLDGQSVLRESVVIRVDFGVASQLKLTCSSANSRDYTISPRRDTYDDYDRVRRLDLDQGLIRKRKYQEYPPAYENDYNRDYDYPRERSYPSPQYEEMRYQSPPRLEYSRERNHLGNRMVVLIDNLPANITCDYLYNFVGYYGDVKRIKILYKKTSSALIQMASESAAEQVIHYLNQIRFDGKDLKVRLSNHDSISMPKSHEDNFHLTKDYSEHHLKRYKRIGSKNFRHIYPPCPVLHLSNVAQLSLDEVKELFSKIAGVEIKLIKSLKSLPGQLLIGFDSITDAIYGIMKLHNYVLPNSTELKVSFSKGFPKT